MKLGMKTNFKTTKQGKFTSIESLKYQANEGVLHYGLTDKSRKKETRPPWCRVYRSPPNSLYIGCAIMCTLELKLQHYCLMALNQIKHLKGCTIKVMQREININERTNTWEVGKIKREQRVSTRKDSQKNTALKGFDSPETTHITWIHVTVRHVALRCAKRHKLYTFTICSDHVRHEVINT